MSSTQFDGDIDSFVSYLKSNRGLSANTLKAYRADLTACLHLFELRGVTDLNEITLDDLRSWMAVESRDHARSSMAQRHAQLVERADPQSRGRARVLRVGL